MNLVRTADMLDVVRLAAATAWDEGFAAQGEQSFDSTGKPMGVIVHNPYRADLKENDHG